jgi:hypothetical protein
VGDPREAVVADVLGANNCRQPGTSARGQRGLGDLDGFERDRRAVRRRDAELVAQQRDGRRGQRSVMAVDAPAPPAHARRVHRNSTARSVGVGVCEAVAGANVRIGG